MSQHFRVVDAARILAAPGCRYPKEFFVTAERARKLVKARKITAEGSDGRTFRTMTPEEQGQAPRLTPLTRISRGGPLAAAGMSQIYTVRNERGAVHGYKFISVEDAGAFGVVTDN